MDWERKVKNIVRETESNLERAKNKLNSSIGKSMQSNPIQEDSVMRADAETLNLFLNGIPKYSGGDSLSSLGRRALTSQPALMSSEPAAGPRHIGSSLIRTQRSMVDEERVGSSLSSLLNQKLYAQNIVIEELSRRLQQSDKDRELFSQQLRQLRNELTTLQNQTPAFSTCTSNTSEFVTRDVFERWRSDVSNELKVVQKTVDVLRRDVTLLKQDNSAEEERSRFKQATKQLQRIVEEECLSLRNDLISTSCRLAKLESDQFDIRNAQFDIRHARSGTDRNIDRSKLLDEIRSGIRGELERSSGAGAWYDSVLLQSERGGRSVGFHSHLSSPSTVSPSPKRSTTLQNLRDKHSTLKQVLDQQISRDSDLDTETEVTTAVTAADYTARDVVGHVTDEPMTSVSPATSDIDVSMLTTEPMSVSVIDLNTSSRRRARPVSSTGKQGASDYIYTEDITTDVSLTEDCLSLDDL